MLCQFNIFLLTVHSWSPVKKASFLKRRYAYPLFRISLITLVQRSSLHIKKTLSEAFPSTPFAKALSPNVLLSYAGIL